MKGILCVELDKNVANLAYKISNIIKRKTIIEEGKCKYLSEKEKIDNKVFFQYATNIDNCYFLRYTDHYPQNEQKEKSIFDDQLQVENQDVVYQKKINIELDTRTKLIDIIKNYYKGLHDFNKDNNIYTQTFEFIFKEHLNSSNTNLEVFMNEYNKNNIIKNIDITILQFMILNLYKYSINFIFNIQFYDYYRNYIKRNFKLSEDLILRIKNSSDRLITHTYYLYGDSVYFAPSKFKPSLEEKTLNFFKYGE